MEAFCLNQSLILNVKFKQFKKKSSLNIKSQEILNMQKDWVRETEIPVTKIVVF